MGEIAEMCDEEVSRVFRTEQRVDGVPAALLAGVGPRAAVEGFVTAGGADPFEYDPVGEPRLLAC